MRGISALWQNRRHRMVLLAMGLFMMMGSLLCERHGAVTLDGSSGRSWYKKSFDACLQAWAEFDFLVQAPEIVGTFDRAAVVDASLCHVAYLGWCLEQMLVHELSRTHPDEMIYLGKMLAALEELCGTAVGTGANDRLSCAHALLRQAYKKIAESVLNQSMQPI